MSEDQVTHTPTPWDLRRREDTEVLGLSKNEEGRNFYILHVAGNSHAPRAIADAEFAHTAINAHDALTARVAELEAENERLRGLLWYAHHEFNAIRARSGAPLDLHGMATVDEQWWNQMTKAFGGALGEAARKPWPSDAAIAALKPEA